MIPYGRHHIDEEDIEAVTTVLRSGALTRVHSLMTVFSFHPVKAIAAGEGGMITTNDDERAARARYRHAGALHPGAGAALLSEAWRPSRTLSERAAHVITVIRELAG